jgi:Uma2 family endonuclease
LAVEVVSPSDQYSEVEEKVEQWLTAGCRMVIVVNPRSKSAVVYRPDGSLKRLSVGDAIDGADVVPGWQLPLGEIFA